MPDFNAGGIYSSINVNMQPFMAGMSQFHNELNKADSASSQKFSSMSMVAGTAMAAIGTAAIAAGKHLFNLAARAEEVDNLFNVSFGNMASYVNNFANTTSSSLGLSDVALKQSLALFNSFFLNMGVQKGMATELSKSMSMLAVDLESFYGTALNLTQEQIMEKIQAGIRGSTESMDVFGVNLLESNLKLYAYKNGIADTGKELNEYQKVLARVGVIQESTKMAQGDWKNTMSSPANTIRIITNEMNQGLSNLGRAFMPAAQMGLSAFEPVVKTFVSLSNVIMRIPEPIRVIAGAGAAAAAGFGILFGVVKGLVGAYANLTQSMNLNTQATVNNFMAHSNLTPFIEADARVAKLSFDVEQLSNKYMRLSMAKNAVDADLARMTGGGPMGFVIDEPDPARIRMMQETSRAYAEEMASVSGPLNKMRGELNDARGEQLALNGAMDEAGKKYTNMGGAAESSAGKIGVMSKAMGILSASFGWVMFAVFAVNALIAGIKYLTTASQRAAEALQKVAQETKTAFQTAHSEYANLRDVYAEYLSLSGKKASNKTAADKERERDLLLQIYQIDTSLVSLDEKGNVVAVKSKEIQEELTKRRQADIDARKKSIQAEIAAQNKLLENAKAEQQGAIGFKNRAKWDKEVADIETKIKKLNQDLENVYNPDFDRKTKFNSFEIPGNVTAAKRTFDDIMADLKKNLGDIDVIGKQLGQKTYDILQSKANELTSAIQEAIKLDGTLNEAQQKEVDAWTQQLNVINNQIKAFDLLSEAQQTAIQGEAEIANLQNKSISVYEQMARKLEAAIKLPGLTDDQKKAMQETIDYLRQLNSTITQLNTKNLIDDLETQLKIIESTGKVLGETQAEIKEKQISAIKDAIATLIAAMYKMTNPDDLAKAEDQLLKLKMRLEDLTKAQKALAKESKTWIDGLIDGLEKANEESMNMYNIGTKIAGDLTAGFETMGDVLLNNMMGMYETQEDYAQAMADSMKRWGQQVLAEYMNLLMRMLAEYLIKKAMGIFFGSDFGGNSNPDVGGGSPPVGGGQAQPRAAGGPVVAGMTYMVGEKGPELWVPPQSGSIIPNNRLGGGPQNININVKNETGQDISLREESRTMDGETYILNVVANAVQTNKKGFGNMIRGRSMG